MKHTEPNSEWLQTLWRQYDANNDGVLDPKELTKIITDYGSFGLDSIQKQKDDAIAEAEGERVAAYALLVSGLTVSEMMYTEMYQNAAKYQPIARRLFDANEDGKVEKDEFMAKFSEVLKDLQQKATQPYLDRCAEKRKARDQELEAREQKETQEKQTGGCTLQ